MELGPATYIASPLSPPPKKKTARENTGCPEPHWAHQVIRHLIWCCPPQKPPLWSLIPNTRAVRAPFCATAQNKTKKSPASKEGKERGWGEQESGRPPSSFQALEVRQFVHLAEHFGNCSAIGKRQEANCVTLWRPKRVHSWSRIARLSVNFFNRRGN